MTVLLLNWLQAATRKIVEFQTNSLFVWAPIQLPLKDSFTTADLFFRGCCGLLIAPISSVPNLSNRSFELSTSSKQAFFMAHLVVFERPRALNEISCTSFSRPGWMRKPSARIRGFAFISEEKVTLHSRKDTVDRHSAIVVILYRASNRLSQNKMLLQFSPYMWWSVFVCTYINMNIFFTFIRPVTFS